MFSILPEVVFLLRTSSAKFTLFHPNVFIQSRTETLKGFPIETLSYLHISTEKKINFLPAATQTATGTELCGKFFHFESASHERESTKSTMKASWYSIFFPWSLSVIKTIYLFDECT